MQSCIQVLVYFIYSFFVLGVYMQSFFFYFGKIYRAVGVAILTIMVLMVFINACMRYAFHSGFIATEEILRYLFIYMTFLGIAEVAYQRGHIAVTILTDALKGRIRTFVYILGYILSIYAIYVLLNGSFMYFDESETSVGQVTGLPFRFIIGVVIFGACGVLLFLVRDLFLGLKALSANTEFPPRPVDEDVEAAIKSMEKQMDDHKENK